MGFQGNIQIALLMSLVVYSSSRGASLSDDHEGGSGQEDLTWPFKSLVLSMVEDIRDDVTDTKEKLRLKNDQLQRSFALLKIDYLQVKYYNNQLKKELQELKLNTQRLETSQKQLEERVSSIDNQKGSTKSAFSAFMNIGYFRPSSDSSRVVVPLNGVKYNLGEHYNGETSTYTCPVSGVYYFSYSVYSGITNQRQSTFAYITVDNTSINSASCDPGSGAFHRCQATNSATVHCNAGGKVYLKTTGKHVEIYGTPAFDRTTFTGFLLYQD